MQIIAGNIQPENSAPQNIYKNVMEFKPNITVYPVSKSRYKII
jgi:hypothetical protein